MERHILAAAVSILVAASGIASGEESEALPPGASPSPIGSEPVQLEKSPVILRGIYGARSLGSRGAPLTSAHSGLSAESAVMGALRWFKSTQGDDGSWGDPATPSYELSALPLLCFLGHGESPASQEFGGTVERALRYLISSQDEAGYFGSPDGALSEQAIVTWAMCEAYGMTRIPMVGRAAEKAIATILTRQSEGGLWLTAEPSHEMPTSIWCVAALKAARMTGLGDAACRDALGKAGLAIASAMESAPLGHDVAPQIYALQLAGMGRRPIVETALRQLDSLSVNWENTDLSNPIYQWHFAAKASFQAGGRVWSRWNQRCAPQLVRHQVVIPKAIEIPHRDKLADIGYWDSPCKDEPRGRIYSTALCCLMLEVYYAYQPSFTAIPDVSPVADDSDLEIDIIE